jgi:transposase
MRKPLPGRYRTTNWSSYTAALSKSGLLLILMGKDITWLSPRGPCECAIGCSHACDSCPGTSRAPAEPPVIFPSNRVQIMVATKPIDLLKGHISLAAMVKNELRKGSFTGTIFVFRATKADRLKLLYWDGTGLVMAYKRLEEHTFIWHTVTDGLMLKYHAQFKALFAGLDLRRFWAIEAKAPEAGE